MFYSYRKDSQSFVQEQNYVVDLCKRVSPHQLHPVSIVVGL